MQRIKDKVAIITGGASGLGAAIAQKFIAEGAKVIITDVQEELGEESANAWGCEFMAQDVTNEEQWTGLIGQVEKKYGALDILVNNAGIVGDFNAATPEETAYADWQRVQKINVDGVFMGCRSVIPALRRSGGGVIINMSSIAAFSPAPKTLSYGTSKGAVQHLTKSVAAYCARDGSKIRCNSINPGVILTPMVNQAISENAEKHNIIFEESLGRFKGITVHDDFIQPIDIANTALFLCSEEARNITGIGVVVDGGSTLSRE